MPNLTIVRHNYHNMQYPSIRAFFMHLLSTIRHSATKGETYELKERVTRALVDAASASGLYTVLLIIDEAQAMTITDLLFLKDVFNELEKHRVSLITVLVGQERQFRDLHQDARANYRDDIIGRFLMRRLPFRPLSTKKDITGILTRIDAEIFPVNSGCSWTEFFFPIAHREGFRMASQGEILYSEILRLAGSKEGALVIPARQLFQTIRNFMFDNSDHTEKELASSHKLWSNAMEDACLAEAMHLGSDHLTPGVRTCSSMRFEEENDDA